MKFSLHGLCLMQTTDNCPILAIGQMPETFAQKRHVCSCCVNDLWMTGMKTVSLVILNVLINILSQSSVSKKGNIFIQVSMDVGGFVSFQSNLLSTTEWHI